MTRPLSSSFAGKVFPALQPQHIQMLSKIANELAEPVDVFRTALELAETIGSSTFTREKVIRMMSEFMLTVSEADVVFVRELKEHDILSLVQQEVWAANVQPIGCPPREKYVEDGPCPRRIPTIGGGNRSPEHSQSARDRGNYYLEEELQFIDWLGSEAWIPIKDRGVTKAVITLGKHQKDFFSPERIKTLAAYQAFAQTFYNLASLADDRIENIELMKKVAAVLPMMTTAESPEGFWRAICTLLTCKNGYRFDRALLFWMHNHSLPATCVMAVGGLGQEASEWTNQRKSLDGMYASLREYIQDSLDHPTPGDESSKSKLPDMLYQLVNDDPLHFTEEDAGRIRELVLFKKDDGGGAIRLTDKDPWIAEVRQKRPGIFASKNGEYFLYPLIPLDSKDQPTLLGFVIADLAYHDEQILPGLGSPNLGIIGMVLNLLSAMWLAREKEETYLLSLCALPDLRHAAPVLDHTLGLLKEEFKEERWNQEIIKRLVDGLIPVAEKLGQVADFAETLRRRRFTEVVSDLPAFLNEFKKYVAGRYHPGNDEHHTVSAA